MKRIESVKLAEDVSEILGLLKKSYSSLYKIKFFEILVFGSTVGKCDDEEVGDLDMIIIDNNQLSPYYEIDCQTEDWYSGLRGNLQSLLDESLGYLDDEMFDKANALLERLLDEDLNVDLHILPLKFFKNKNYRMEVLSKHKDPNFFKNCFSSMLRLRMGKQFVPINVSYFEYKYKCDLRDLKK